MNETNIVYVENLGDSKKHIHSLHANNKKFNNYMLSLYHSTDDPCIKYSFELWKIKGVINDDLGYHSNNDC